MKKSFRKRVRRPRRSRRRRVPRNKLFKNSLVPTRFLGKLSYVEQVSLDPALGGYQSVLYRANDLYDPTFAAGGHQPLGFDQMMALYQKFHVIGSKITVRFACGDSTSNASTAVVGVYTTTSPTALPDVLSVLEQPGCNWKYVQLGANIATVSNKYSVKRSQGVKNIMDNIELAGGAAQSPNIVDYFRVFVESGTGLDALPVKLTVKIDYIAVFTDPVQQIGS